MRCIISGFDPFDSAGTNPSQLAVERLPSSLTLDNNERVDLVSLVLPTCCDSAWEPLRQAIDQAAGHDEPFAVVMSGVAEGRDKITPEYFAVNMRHYRVADNQGHQWRTQPIDDAGAQALISPLDLPRLVDSLCGKGLKCDISFHAGTFVCNETYYRALQRLADEEQCLGAVFVHLPSVENYGKQVDADPLEHYTGALIETAKFIFQKAQRPNS